MKQIDFTKTDFVRARNDEVVIDYVVKTCATRYISILAAKDVLINVILGRMIYRNITLNSGDALVVLDSITETSATKTDGITGQQTDIKPSNISQEGIVRIDARVMVEYDLFDGELGYVLEASEDKYDGNVDFNLYPNNGSLSGRYYNGLSISHKEHKDSCIIKLINEIRALGHDLVKLTFTNISEGDEDNLAISAYISRKDMDHELLIHMHIDVLSHDVLWMKSDVFKTSADSDRLQALVSVLVDEDISYLYIRNAMETQHNDKLIAAMINIK